MVDHDLDVWIDFQHALRAYLLKGGIETLPRSDIIVDAVESLYKHVPDRGVGIDLIYKHLLDDVVPGLNLSSLSPTYYGFVTGGITPAARLGESVVSVFDQNVSVHLPEETISTIVEDRALTMLLELFDLNIKQWPSRTFTTGATGSNVLGLACGRDFIINKKLSTVGQEYIQGEGILESCLRAGVRKLQVLTTIPHSSLGKAANAVGIGGQSIIDVSRESHFLEFDMVKLEEHLATPCTASVVAISCGEVNTGLFATNSWDEVETIRQLCDRYGAWLHVDAAFGIFARVLPATGLHSQVVAGAAGIELADSIGGDGHKILNVPYDCGFFFCRHRDVPARVFQNLNAAYLNSKSTDDIMSPLNIRMENSARFRGLPVYTTLVAYGKSGIIEMVSHMVDLARAIAAFIQNECSHLELLPGPSRNGDYGMTYICVLFRAKDDDLNSVLTEKIKASKKVYVSSTQWDGKPAVRFAVSKWDAATWRDLPIIKEVLLAVMPP